MIQNEVFKCSVCKLDYDQETHRPMMICGNYHTMCLQCLNHICKIESKSYACPFCRTAILKAQAVYIGCFFQYRREAEQLILQKEKHLGEIIDLKSKVNKYKEKIEALRDSLHKQIKGSDQKQEINEELRKEKENLSVQQRKLDKFIVKIQAQNQQFKNQINKLKQENKTLSSQRSNFKKLVSLPSKSAKRNEHYKQAQLQVIEIDKIASSILFEKTSLKMKASKKSISKQNKKKIFIPKSQLKDLSKQEQQSKNTNQIGLKDDEKLQDSFLDRPEMQRQSQFSQRQTYLQQINCYIQQLGQTKKLLQDSLQQIQMMRELIASQQKQKQHFKQQFENKKRQLQSYCSQIQWIKQSLECLEEQKKCLEQSIGDKDRSLTLYIQQNMRIKKQLSILQNNRDQFELIKQELQFSQSQNRRLRKLSAQNQRKNNVDIIKRQLEKSLIQTQQIQQQGQKTQNNGNSKEQTNEKSKNSLPQKSFGPITSNQNPKQSDQINNNPAITKWKNWMGSLGGVIKQKYNAAIVKTPEHQRIRELQEANKKLTQMVTNLQKNKLTIFEENQLANDKRLQQKLNQQKIQHENSKKILLDEVIRLSKKQEQLTKAIKLLKSSQPSESIDEKQIQQNYRINQAMKHKLDLLSEQNSRYIKQIQGLKKSSQDMLQVRNLLIKSIDNVTELNESYCLRMREVKNNLRKLQNEQS